MVLTFVLLIWVSFSSSFFVASIGKHSLRITCPVLLSFASSSREALSIGNVDDEIVFYRKQKNREIKVQSGSGYLGLA